MANKRNEIFESETDHRQADYILYCNIPHSTNQSLSTVDRSENQRLFHKILDDLIHSTTQMLQNKQVDLIIRDLSISTSCKLEESISTCVSSIENNTIERDAGIVDSIKHRMMDMITSIARFGEDFDETWRENLSSIVEDFIREVSLRDADYAAKYADNVRERGCASRCVATQSDIVDEEFGSKTSLDAFKKACEERRHMDSILDQIAKLCDAVSEGIRLTSLTRDKRADTCPLTTDKMEEGICEKAKSLMSIINAQGGLSDLTTNSVTTLVIQQNVNSSESVSSIPFVQEAQDSPVYLDTTDESLDIARVQVISLIEESNNEEKKKSKEDETFLRSMLDKIVLAASQNQDIEITRAVAEDDGRKEEEEERNGKQIDVSPQQTSDQDVLVVDKIAEATVDSSIMYSIQEKENSNRIDVSLLRQEAVSVINDIVDSFVDTSRVEQEPTKEIAKDSLQKIVPLKYEMPKYRSIDTSYLSCFIAKKEKMPPCKKIRHAKKLSTCTFLSFASCEPIRRSYCKRSITKMCQDDGSRLPRVVLPIGCCGALIPYNVYLGKAKYCDIRTTSCFDPQIAAIQETTLSNIFCPSLRDSRAIGYHDSCRSLIDNRNASLRHCNINCYTNRRAICENSSHPTYDTCYKIDIKCYYPRLNHVNNIRMGYYHCNANCPAWKNNRQCERSRSHRWWGNFYFTHR